MWIESHQTLARHPKVIRLAARLGVSKPAAIGHLHLLWWWALDFAQDGNLSRFETDEIASGAEWSGPHDDFVAALRECGWIDGDEIHDWNDYGGRMLQLREGNRERQQRHREQRRHALVTRESRVSHALRNGYITGRDRDSNALQDITGQDITDTHSVARAQEPGQQTETPAVEPPPGFPKTETEAVDRCAALGVPPEFIRSTWLRASGRGGRDARDVPIRNFPAHVQSCWGYEQSRKAERANGEPGRGQGESGSSVAIIRDQKALERVEKAIADLKAGAGSDAFGPMYSEEDRKRLKELKASRKELIARLGMVA